MTRHLLHIGYPKSGSTYLQRWFAKHPQLAYVEGGIAGFRDVYAMARAGTKGGSAPLYRVTSCEGLSAPQPDAGQIVVDYDRARAVDLPAAQRHVCETLHDLFPNATVLIVTRGFRSMILSSYSQFVRSGGDAELGQLAAVAMAGPGHAEFDYLVYDHLIGAYTERFGAGNVIVMPYELLRDDPHAFTRILSERLGIEPVQGSRERVNESLSPVEMYWYPRLTRIARKIPSRRVFRRYVGAAFYNRLRTPIRILQRLRPGTPITDALIPDEVVELFRGRAESLRNNPLYEHYKADYLL